MPQQGMAKVTPGRAEPHDVERNASQLQAQLVDHEENQKRLRQESMELTMALLEAGVQRLSHPADQTGHPSPGFLAIEPVGRHEIRQLHGVDRAHEQAISEKMANWAAAAVLAGRAKADELSVGLRLDSHLVVERAQEKAWMSAMEQAVAEQQLMEEEGGCKGCRTMALGEFEVG